MPTYDYICASCREETEAFQKITEEPKRQCPSCGDETLKRVPGGRRSSFSFRGSGFYITDYPKGKKSD